MIDSLTNPMKSLSKGTYTVALLSILFLISSCSSWPPYKTEARKYFYEKRDTFELLAAKMRETEYWRVSIYRAQGAEVRVSPNIEDISEDFILNDDPEWRELLNKLHLYMVLQSNGKVSFNDGTGLWGKSKNQVGFSGLFHSPSIKGDYVLCKPEFEKIPCGKCAIAIENDWYIYHQWSLLRFYKAEFEKYLNGDISLDYYNKKNDKARTQCHINGYKKMGYDIDKIFK